ncbi:hypothetical protein Tco_0536785 [Tanacetum coccineum]
MILMIFTVPEDVTVFVHALDYSSPPLWDDYDDNLFDHETSGDSVFYEDFFEVDALSSTNNEDKVFNPGILIHENLFQVTNFATPDKNANKITISNASLIPEDFNPPTLYELPCHKEVPGLGILLLFSSENEEKFSTTGILTSIRAINASSILEDLDPPLSLYELPLQKEVYGLGALLLFSSKNEEKVFNPGILTSKGVHTSLLSELSFRGPSFQSH